MSELHLTRSLAFLDLSKHILDDEHYFSFNPIRICHHLFHYYLLDFLLCLHLN